MIGFDLGAIFKNKWAILAIVSGIVILIIYLTQSAKDEANSAAANLESGGVGATLGNTVSSFFKGLFGGTNVSGNQSSSAAAQ